MNFEEAIKKLEEGQKISRPHWKGLYLEIQQDQVYAFEPSLTYYNYNANIMTSENWVVDNGDGTESRFLKFAGMVPLLIKGLKASKDDWEHGEFIYFDKSEGKIVKVSNSMTSFVPEFSSFLANDWIEL